MKHNFSENDTVIYRGKTLKIHSFSVTPGMVNLKKYRKDGKIDGRDRGYYAKVSDLTPVNEGQPVQGEGLPDKLDVHSTGLFPMKAELHPENDPDGLIILADVQTMELANEIVERYNEHLPLLKENEQLKEQVRVLREALRLIYTEIGHKDDSHLRKRINTAINQTETK